MTLPFEPQRVAADPEISAFVTANAGSGKTKTLIDRVARLLLDAETPKFPLRRGLHSMTLVPQRQLGEWFEDFWQK